ncbi:MAG: hypothetical protein E7485_01855 [Ruminococcaceae bacterium]|nr:hypothetical protein [Oscillospiraceae bacterium]
MTNKINTIIIAALLAVNFSTVSAQAAPASTEVFAEDIAEEDVLPDIADEETQFDSEYTEVEVEDEDPLPDYEDDTMDFMQDIAIEEPSEDFAASTPEEFEQDTAPTEPLDYPDYLEEYGQGGNGTEEVLEKYYGKFGYPEYISYVYNIGAESFSSESEYADMTFWYYTVALTENTPENQQAVLDVAAENCYIKFVDAKWSYNERKAVYDELCAMELEGIQIEMSANSHHVNAYAFEANTDVIPEYDGMVEIIIGVIPNAEIGADGAVPGLGLDGGVVPEADLDGSTITTGFVDDKKEQLPVWAWAGIAVIAFVAVGGAIVLIRKNRVSVNSDGSAEVAASVTKKEVVEMISDSTEKPSDELKDKIMRGL